MAQGSDPDAFGVGASEKGQHGSLITHNIARMQCVESRMRGATQQLDPTLKFGTCLCSVWG